MRAWGWVSAIFVCLGGPALAQPATVISSKPDSVAVVVYPFGYSDGLAMVTESRTVDLPAGPVRLEFRGVADQIRPQTVALVGAGVAEQNFDYQLLSPYSLFRTSQGREVGLVRTDPTTGVVTERRARVVASDNGVVLSIDGRLEALRCSGLPERLVFDDLPAGFVAEPTLSVLADSPQARRTTLKLSYLATGLSWTADYVASIRPGESALDLEAWVTITNESATRFDNAPVQVLAGELNIEDYDFGLNRPQTESDDNCWKVSDGRRGPARTFGLAAGQSARAKNDFTSVEEVISTGTFIAGAAEPLGDYKLYNLPEPTTVEPMQTKQVLLMDQEGVQFERVFSRIMETIDYAESDPRPVQANMLFRFKNERSAGLGLPMPEGNFVFFDATPNSTQILLGEAPLYNGAPEGAPLQLRVRQPPTPVYSFVEYENKRAAKIDPATTRRGIDVKVTLSNDTDHAVAFEINEPGDMPDYGVTEVRISKADHPFERGPFSYDLTTQLPPRSTNVIHYTVDWLETF